MKLSELSPFISEFRPFDCSKSSDVCIEIGHGNPGGGTKLLSIDNRGGGPGGVLGSTRTILLK